MPTAQSWNPQVNFVQIIALQTLLRITAVIASISITLREIEFLSGTCRTL